METTPQRPIRSFVRREGRITAAQQQALLELLPEYRITREKIAQQSAAGIPIVLEIGFGNGEALLAMARQRPECFFIGAEVYQPGLGRCLLRTRQHQLNNIAVFDQDVNELLSELIPVNALDQICIFFPDPWPKKRHHKRRLLNNCFLKQLATRTRHSGLLYIATDWLDYAESLLEVMADQPAWNNLSNNGDYVPRPGFRPLTRFEQRGTRLGHQVFDFCFRHQPPQDPDL